MEGRCSPNTTYSRKMIAIADEENQRDYIDLALFFPLILVNLI